MEKKLIYRLDEAQTGELHGNAGIFRVLIDKDMGGAEHFSLLVNTSKAGRVGKEHSHTVEHCWYILSGTCTFYMDGVPHKVGPNTAIFTPKGVPHYMIIDPDEDLTYIVIYAPPGPEQQLKEKEAHAFDEP
ncbi:MAG: cupin domain-containing protein [Sphaerochaetaceae bacterium]|jgi:mannose-6-phosphate isomerase-like protein (cupin superfamily)